VTLKGVMNIPVLNAAAINIGGLCEATVILRPVVGQIVPAPEATRRMAHDVLKQAEAESGVTPQISNILENLHSFTVFAPRKFVEAVANSQNVAQVVYSATESALIQPVGGRVVRLPDEP
jgi:hypothetical protein